MQQNKTSILPSITSIVKANQEGNKTWYFKQARKLDIFTFS